MKAYRSRTGQLYQMLTADVPAPLPNKEHTVRTKYRINKEEHVNRRGSIFLRFRFIAYNVSCPLMMNHNAQRNAIPCCLSICGNFEQESLGSYYEQESTGGERMTFIASRMALNALVPILQVIAMFSFKSGLLLVRHKAATQIIV